jgi:TolA-binding protein
MRTAIILLVIGVGGGVAHASPVQLTKDQVFAAARAAYAILPPVDKAKSALCQKELDTANGHADPPAAELMQIAACWRGAGSLGAAVVMWNHVIADYPNSREAKQAQRELGPAYEAAGMYPEAAAANVTYASKYRGEADARDRLVRAICTSEQLGDTDHAAAGLVELARWKQKIDPVTLCATVRPIQPPAASP